MESEDYDSTPSYYANQETFDKYLGQTSYYLALQSAVTKIAALCKPGSIAELGSGTGATAIALSEASPGSDVLGVDNRASMVEASRNYAAARGASGVRFELSDLISFVDDYPAYDMIVMLYSFHHIPDPLDDKIDFLKRCYKQLPKGSWVCIAETFLQESPDKATSRSVTDALWSVRPLEGYASTFWSALQGVTATEVEQAQEVGWFSYDHEAMAGRLVNDREGEYLVSRDWVVNTAEKVGFSVVLNEPVNAVGDGVILLKT